MVFEGRNSRCTASPRSSATCRARVRFAYDTKARHEQLRSPEARPLRSDGSHRPEPWGANLTAPARIRASSSSVR